MKKQFNLPLSLVLCVFALFLNAQSNLPYGFNYQAVARDANGNSQINTTLGTRYTIRSGAANGTVVWQETQTVITNSMGQFNHTVGMGTRVGGTALQFKDIDWSASLHFLEVEVQVGALPYASIGNQQMMSVPYALAAPDPTPAGVISAFGGAIAPQGYLICDGSAVSRTTYGKLYAAIGTAYGAGDGSTTFNLPDLRGMFLRGVDGTAGNDPDSGTRTQSNSGGNTGNNVGSKQTDAFQGHDHNVTTVLASTTNGGGSSEVFDKTANITNNGAATDQTDGVIDGSNGIARYANETRPKNVNVNFIIKY